MSGDFEQEFTLKFGGNWATLRYIPGDYFSVHALQIFIIERRNHFICFKHVKQLYSKQTTVNINNLSFDKLFV